MAPPSPIKKDGPVCGAVLPYPEDPIEGTSISPRFGFLPTDQEIRQFEFDDPAFVERTPYGDVRWNILQGSVWSEMQRRDISNGHRRWYDDLSRELKWKKVLFWENNGSPDITRAVLTVPYNDGDGKPVCVQLALAYKGDLKNAKKVHFLIPGYGIDNYGFKPTLEKFNPEPDEAIVSAAIIGAGTNLPKSVNLTPKALTEIYTGAVRIAAPNVNPDGGLTVAGNSMGAMVALGVVLNLQGKYDIFANYIGDEPMGFDPVGTADPKLVKTMKLVSWWEFMTRLGLGIMFSSNSIASSIIDDWYGYNHDGVDHEPSREADFYFSNLFNYPAPAGGRTPIGVLASIGMGLDEWDEYYMAAFGGEGVTSMKQEMLLGISPPRYAVVSHALGNNFFGQDVSLDLYGKLDRNGFSNVFYRTTPGPHVEGTPRMAWHIEFLKTLPALKAPKKIK